jgi:hypothetical protein
MTRPRFSGPFPSKFGIVLPSLFAGNYYAYEHKDLRIGIKSEYAARAPHASPECFFRHRHAGSRPLKKQDAFLVVISVNPRAFRASPLSSLCAAGHVDTLAVDECICDLAPGFMQVAPRGLARDSHPLCRLFLFQTFEIDEPYQFNLIGLQRDALARCIGKTTGFVTAGFRAAGYGAPEPWSSPAGTLFCLVMFFRCHIAFLIIFYSRNS